jgi:glycosyltransferase involved in cell wall biosynthesis
MSKPRVLIIAHGHPDFSVGGGEIAAYAQWQELKRRGIDTMFLARTAESPRHPGAAFSNRSADGSEVLFSAPPVNHFRHSQPAREVVYREFRALLERFKPTVVHFHHYVHLGLEMIREVRKFMPQGRIILTLHEFLGICNAHGQMLKTNGVLCSKALPLDCHRCFPDISPQDFFMRELFVKSFFNLCDLFVTPSEFLRDRYVAWGLPAPKMLVLENGQPRRELRVVPKDTALAARFVVLGQLSRLKGTLVLLEAARLLSRRLKRLIRIEIHGSMQHETEDFKREFHEALAKLSGTVSYCGPYRHGDVMDIIAKSGWVVQPSIWWENSPLVIQEAFAAGRPVICSNVGGMAEKVQPGVGGLHFRVGSSSDLASQLEYAATHSQEWEALCTTLPTPPLIEETVERLLAAYSGNHATADAAPQSELAPGTKPRRVRA